MHTFKQFKGGDQLFIETFRDKAIKLTVRHPAAPAGKTMIVIVDSIPGNHGLALGQPAMLSTGTWGDISTREAVTYFKAPPTCITIGNGHWVNLLQLYVPAVIFRVKSLTIMQK